MEIDIKQFLVTGEDGTTTVDMTGLGSAVQKHIDSKVSKGVETGVENYKKKNQSGEEQYLREISDLKMQLNRSECKSLLSSDLFTEKEKEVLLASLVDNDLAKSQERINSLVVERKTFIENHKTKILESLQGKTPKVENAPVTPPAPKQKPQSFQEYSESIKKEFRT